MLSSTTGRREIHIDGGLGIRFRKVLGSYSWRHAVAAHPSSWRSVANCRKFADGRESRGLLGRTALRPRWHLANAVAPVFSVSNEYTTAVVWRRCLPFAGGCAVRHPA